MKIDIDISYTRYLNTLNLENPNDYSWDMSDPKKTIIDKFSKERFIEKINTDSDFAERWGIVQNTLEWFKTMLEPFKNTLVIEQYRVVLLMDVIDGGDDYYWVVDDWGEITHVTCVGSWIGLKGVISDDDYERMKRVWNLNQTNKAI